MSFRYYDFECTGCKHIFEEMVLGSEGLPSNCPQCESAGPFFRLVSAPRTLSTIIPSYPGSKKNTAGFGAEARRPAEKAGRQVSMAGTGGVAKKATT